MTWFYNPTIVGFAPFLFPSNIRANISPNTFITSAVNLSISENRTGRTLKHNPCLGFRIKPAWSFPSAGRGLYQPPFYTVINGQRLHRDKSRWWQRDARTLTTATRHQRNLQKRIGDKQANNERQRSKKCLSKNPPTKAGFQEQTLHVCPPS